ncbi:MAG: tryptophan synthase subunit alpha [Pseudomonadota bacterium]|nr:tryptophan synthase subunit alpha [Pseudomonadota bacterium]|tara:strand:+ start:201 stop:998 length:798 start_codon:yes stop_codon:yes gene_type:complete
MNRINTVFRRQKSAFISYLVCGDPDLNTTLKIMHSMVKNGVDLIEVGVPFTDPIADGPVIQKGIERALKNKVSLIDVFDLVEKFRKEDKKTPIVLMGYLNPIENMGYRKFSKLAKSKGVDGILIVDLPPEESLVINKELIRNNLSQIFLASPTTEDKRLKSIIKYSSGYLYYVSLKGITGSSLVDFQPIKKRIKMIKKLSDNKIPVSVGFGIKTAETARKISLFSDGIIIGSSIVELIEKNQHNKAVMHKKIIKFIKSIRSSLGT